MDKLGPILVAEDDEDDKEILTEVFESLKVQNEIKFFRDGKAVLDYLMETEEKPFMIITDVNLPRMSGTELAQRIFENQFLRQKSIPFIFLTTSANPNAVKQAYDMMVQGYFQKQHNFEQVKRMIQLIIDYWTICKHPNNN